MSIQSEVARLQTAKNELASAIADKGVSVPAGAKIDDFPALVASIAQGVGGGPWTEITYDELTNYLELGIPIVATIYREGESLISLPLVSPLLYSSGDAVALEDMDGNSYTAAFGQGYVVLSGSGMDYIYISPYDERMDIAAGWSIRYFVLEG